MALRHQIAALIDRITITFLTQGVLANMPTDVYVAHILCETETVVIVCEEHNDPPFKETVLFMYDRWCGGEEVLPSTRSKSGGGAGWGGMWEVCGGLGVLPIHAFS